MSLEQSIQRATESWKCFCELMYQIVVYPNNRVKHLAKHAKKHRTRKKNQHRALYI